jgi:hypothetical protein
MIYLSYMMSYQIIDELSDDTGCLDRYCDGGNGNRADRPSND